MPPEQNNQPANIPSAGPTMLERLMPDFLKAKPQQTGSGPQNNGKNANNADVVTQNNSSNDPSANSGNANAGEKSPLDGFAKLWETKKDEKGNPIQDSGPEPLFKPDQKALGEAVGKMKFTDKLDPELVKKAMSGDHESFASAINSVAQQSFQQALLASSQMMEGAFSKKMAEFQKQSETQFKNLRTKENLTANNPMYNNPAFKPFAEFMQSKFQNAYPEASPSEISTHMENYFKEFSNSFGKSGENEDTDADGKTPQQRQAKAQDFSDFFG